MAGSRPAALPPLSGVDRRHRGRCDVCPWRRALPVWPSSRCVEPAAENLGPGRARSNTRRARRCLPPEDAQAAASVALLLGFGDRDRYALVRPASEWLLPLRPCHRCEAVGAPARKTILEPERGVICFQGGFLCLPPDGTPGNSADTRHLRSSRSAGPRRRKLHLAESPAARSALDRTGPR